MKLVTLALSVVILFSIGGIELERHMIKNSPVMGMVDKIEIVEIYREAHVWIEDEYEKWRLKFSLPSGLRVYSSLCGNRLLYIKRGYFGRINAYSVWYKDVEHMTVTCPDPEPIWRVSGKVTIR